jgi:biotin operon repressor
VAWRVWKDKDLRDKGVNPGEHQVAQEYRLLYGPPVDDLELRVSAKARCKGDARFRGTFQDKGMVTELKRICSACPVKEECEELGERLDAAFVVSNAVDHETGRSLRVGAGFFAGRTPIERAKRREPRRRESCPPEERKARLVELLGRGETSQYELAQALGVSPKTVRRTIAQLRDEGVPIKSRRGGGAGGGGYWLEEQAAA